ncbi:MAG: signal peptidase I [Thermoanaerobaculia bacterium]
MNGTDGSKTASLPVGTSRAVSPSKMAMPLRFIVRAFVLPIVSAIVLACLVRAAVVRFYVVSSASMEPTLLDGDLVAVTPYWPPWRAADPHPGDVVVFKAREHDRFLIKRVVAREGDHVEIYQGRLRLNGHPVAEPYIRAGDPGEARPPEILTAGELYVLGDNRGDSVDSRAWGFVDRAEIVGRARMIVWSAPEPILRSAAEAESSRPSIPHDAAANRFARVFRTIR